MPNTHGRFAWHELITTDPDAAKAFYPPIMSWTVEPLVDEPNYALLLNDGVAIGGVMPLVGELATRGVQVQWLPYVQVYDVDECVRQVVTLGGQVRMPPKEVPTVGCWAVIADPQGAVIGVYEPASNEPVKTGAPRRGDFSWHDLATTDYKAAADFYRALFRWETIQDHDMGPMGIYRLFGQKGVQYGGMFNKPPQISTPNWLSYVRVDDVKQKAQQVEQLGGKIMVPPMEVPGGDWIAQCTDAQGAMFALHTPKAS
jgi:predicted enzyme related to lactoylglutathione lyase